MTWPQCGHRLRTSGWTILAVLAVVVGVPAYCMQHYVAEGTRLAQMSGEATTPNYERTVYPQQWRGRGLSVARAGAMGELIRRQGFECPAVNAVEDVKDADLEAAIVNCGPVDQPTAIVAGQEYWVVLSPKSAVEIAHCENSQRCLAVVHISGR